MLRAIFWKEWRQQSPFLFAILILMPIIGVICWAAGMSGNERSFSIANLALVLAVCAAVIQAIVTGSLLFASEVEEGTLPFLDACSAERGRIWRAKMLSGLAIAMPALVLPTLLGGFAGLQASILAAETVLMTAAVSVFVRTTFRAIGVAALLLCVITIVLVKLETVSATAALGLNLLIVGVLTFASRHRFCRQDRERHADDVPLRIVRLLRSPTWMTASLWLVVRRQWLTLLAVGVAFAGFVGWLASSQYAGWQSFMVAPAILFAVGCGLGWNVFALEQAGVERFLGNQRVPRTRLWLAKVGIWLAVTVIAAWAFDLVCDSKARWFYDIGISTGRRALVLGFLGFAAGQFFGLHFRQLPVAIFLTLLLSAPMAAAWYAPLFGGEPAWHFGLVPILLLAATRFEIRPWSTGRLDGLARWIRCGVVVLGCFAWSGLVLRHRIAEVPDVGELFVLRENPTETAREQQRRLRLREPAAEASRRYRESDFDRDDLSLAGFSQWHEPGLDLGAEPSLTLRSFSERVFALGAPDEGRDDFRRTLMQAFKGDWSTSLRKELADQPRRVSLPESQEFGQTLHGISSATRLYCLRSMLLLAEGDPKGALNDFGVALAFERYLELEGNLHRPGGWSWNDDDLLEAAETMLRRGGDDPTFCRGLLALLNHHAQEMPSFSDSIRATYLATNSASEWELSTRRLNLDATIGRASYLFDSPVESIRDDRLQRAFCRGLLNAAEQKTLFLRPPTRSYEKGWERQIRYFAAATPDCDADAWRRILSHQAHRWLSDDFFDQINRNFPALAAAAARRNALRLACAAALFRHDHGRDLGSLAELASEYFPTLPESPYAECAFAYRRSSGETWIVDFAGDSLGLTPFDTGLAIRRTVAPGTGVIEIPCLPRLKFVVPSLR